MEQQAVALRPSRARFHNEYEFACWWWKLIMNSWDLEAERTGDIWSTIEVLELGLRIDDRGGYALGTRGPRLGDDRAPWRHYPSLEAVRRRGLHLPDLEVGQPGFEVVPWPRPPPGFKGGLAARLPRSGVDLRITPVAGDRLRLRVDVFSVAGHELNNPDIGINWVWSGVSEEQEAVEAQRCAARAEAFRAMARGTDFFDFGSCSEGSSASEEDY